MLRVLEIIPTMTITPAMILTWRTETASTMPETSTIWADMTSLEKLSFLDWLSKQTPVDQAEKDQDK